MERGASSGGASFFEGFVSHFGELGITGQGLEVAAQGSPLVGPIISASHFPCPSLPIQNYFGVMIKPALPSMMQEA
jgi:hypothetical protein